jgi:hypothetical protein
VHTANLLRDARGTLADAPGDVAGKRFSVHGVLLRVGPVVAVSIVFTRILSGRSVSASISRAAPGKRHAACPRRPVLRDESPL